MTDIIFDIYIVLFLMYMLCLLLQLLCFRLLFICIVSASPVTGSSVSCQLVPLLGPLYRVSY